MQISDINIFVAGIGSIGKRHTEVLYSSLGCKNITIYDPVSSSLKAMTEKFPGIRTVSSFEEGLQSNPHAVWITMPTALHIKHTIPALEAGCHVMIEKPLDVSFENIEKVKSLIVAKKKIVSVAFCYRQYTGMKRIKEIINSGILGRIVNIKSTMAEFFPDARPDYKNTYYVKYNGAFELIHAVDSALWLAGGDPVKICGICGSYSDIGFESPDIAEILFETETRVLCNVTLNYCRSPLCYLMNVNGTAGSLEMNFSSDVYELKTYTRGGRKWTTEKKKGLYRNLMFEREDREFLEDTITGVQRGCSVRDAERSLKIYCELYGNNNADPSLR
jgi:predicted dehydrogenase